MEENNNQLTPNNNTQAQNSNTNIGSIKPAALPNSTAVLVLGILSIVLCWCIGIVGLTLGVIALIMSNKAKKLYQENSDMYSEVSYKNMNAGRICSIIGICLSGLYVVYLIVYFLIIGAAVGAMSTFPWEVFNQY